MEGFGVPKYLPYRTVTESLLLYGTSDTTFVSSWLFNRQK